MAITNASRLADFGSGIGTAGAVLQIDNANDRIGIGTTNPTSKLTVAGSFYSLHAETIFKMYDTGDWSK